MKLLMQNTADGVKARAEVMEVIMPHFEELLTNLYFRWSEESQYEDFSEYSEVLKNKCTNNFRFIKATKRPFGLVIRPTDFPYDVHITINRNSIGWKVLNGK